MRRTRSIRSAISPPMGLVTSAVRKRVIEAAATHAGRVGRIEDEHDQGDVVRPRSAHRDRQPAEEQSIITVAEQRAVPDSWCRVPDLRPVDAPVHGA